MTRRLRRRELGEGSCSTKASHRRGPCTKVQGFFFIGAPGRAHLLDGDGKIFPKSITHPIGGSVSWTARVSIARWNLKEAAGKALA